MEQPQKLNLPPIKLSAIEREGRTLVFDIVRNNYVVLTPEEWVRQHIVAYLISHCNVPLRSITEEYPVNINSTAQRADVVVFNPQAKPWILVECKAPEVKIDNTVFNQAARYNSIIQAQYIILTNGLTHYCLEKCDNEYVPLTSFPHYDQCHP